jgi:predicted dehydrogenase
MTKISVAMVGAGHVHAPSYLDRLSVHPGVRLVGVYDENPERAAQVAGRAGTGVFPSPEAAVAAAEAVVVCSEPTRQFALVRVAARQGRPTLCEKPVGTYPAEADALLALAEEAAISVALPVRYHQAAVRLRSSVRAGLLGRGVAVWGTNRNSFPGGWFADPALAGGGCLLDHVVHLADLLRWIWETEFSCVMAEAGVRHTAGLQMEDTAAVLVECTNGMIATIDPSMSRPQAMPGALDLVMDVYGELGTAKVDIFADRIESIDAEGGTQRQLIGEDMDSSMISEWIDSVRSGGPPPVPVRDAFAATSLAFAAQRAVSTHQAVSPVH